VKLCLKIWRLIAVDVETRKICYLILANESLQMTKTAVFGSSICVLTFTGIGRGRGILLFARDINRNL